MTLDFLPAEAPLFVFACGTAGGPIADGAAAAAVAEEDDDDDADAAASVGAGAAGRFDSIVKTNPESSATSLYAAEACQDEKVRTETPLTSSQNSLHNTYSYEDL